MIVADVQRDAADETVASVAPGHAIAVACDVGDGASVERAVEEGVVRFGALHVLYNNAGGSSFRDGPVTEVPEDEFLHVMRTEVWGLFTRSRHAIPHTARAGGGAVIYATSIFASKGYPGRTYSASAIRRTSPRWRPTSRPVRRAS